MAIKKKTKKRTECQDNYFPDDVIRTFKARILINVNAKHLRKKTDENRIMLNVNASHLREKTDENRILLNVNASHLREKTDENRILLNVNAAHLREKTNEKRILLPDVSLLPHHKNKKEFFIDELKLKKELTPKETLKLKRWEENNLKMQETKEILQFFAQSLGNTRFVWNHFLALTQQKYQDFKTSSEAEKNQTVQVEVKNKENQESIIKEKPLHSSYYTKNELSSLLTQMKKDENYTFLNRSHSQSLQNVVEILSDSLIKSIQKRKKGENSEVRFKKKKDDSSFTIKQVNGSHINFKKGEILLPKLKKILKFRASQKIHKDEKVKTVQIVKEDEIKRNCFQQLRKNKGKTGSSVLL